METITLTYSKSYTDTSDHILFAAKFYGYQETYKELIGGISTGKTITNTQTPGDFMIEKIDTMVKDFMTKPIQAYIKAEAIKQAEVAAKQAAEVVLNKIA